MESSYVFWLGIALPIAGVIVFSLMAPTARHALSVRFKEFTGSDEPAEEEEESEAPEARDMSEVDKFLTENGQLFSAWAPPEP